MLCGTPYVPFCALKLLIKGGIGGDMITGGETPAANYDRDSHFDRT